MDSTVKFNLHWLTYAQYVALATADQTVQEDIYFISDKPILFVNGEQRGRTDEELRNLFSATLKFAGLQADLAGGALSETEATSYTKIVYVESLKKFLAVQGNTYYTSWKASDIAIVSDKYTSANEDTLYFDGVSLYGWNAGELQNLSVNIVVLELSAVEATVNAYTSIELSDKFGDIANLFKRLKEGKVQILVKVEDGYLLPVAFSEGTNSYKIEFTEFAITVTDTDGALSALYEKQKIAKIDNSLLEVVLVKTLREAAQATDNNIVTEKGIRTVVDLLLESIKTLNDGTVVDFDTEAIEGQPDKFKLVGKNAEGTNVTSVDLDRENFMSAFTYRDAVEADATADETGNTKVGDKLLIVTMTNGSTFTVNLTELVNIYVGETADAVTVTVTGDKIKAALKIENSKSIKLTQTTTGLKAEIILADQSDKSFSLEETDNGVAVAARWITHE